MARETDIEIEEREVERVYCDDCGADCTDKHRVEPKDVCPSCASGSAFDSVKELFSKLDDSNDEPPFLGMVILAIIYPLTVAILLGSIEWENKSHRHGIKLMFMCTLGTTLWGGFAVAVYLSMP